MTARPYEGSRNDVRQIANGVTGAVYPHPVCLIQTRTGPLWTWLYDPLSICYAVDDHDHFVIDFLEKHVEPGMTVVDVGAHVGFFTRIAAELVGEDGHVHAIEASSANAEILAENVKDLPVTVHVVAVSDEDGTGTLWHHPNSGQNSIMAEGHADRAPGIGFAVEVRKLDTLFAHTRVDVVKIDVEEAEPRALTGMREILERDRPFVLSDLAVDQDYPGAREALSWLSKLPHYEVEARDSAVYMIPTSRP